MKKSAFLSVIDSLVPISFFNQGKANQIISKLHHDDVKIIVKNNEPMAALIPISRYSELIEAEELLKAKESK